MKRMLAACLAFCLTLPLMPGAAAYQASVGCQYSPPQAADPSPVILSLLGDVSIGDAYHCRKQSTSLTSAILDGGLAWPFALVSGALLADGLTAANLEVCLTDRNKRKGKAHDLVAPPSFAQALPLGGVDVVNTVNNHCFDFGQAGYQDTLAALDGAGVSHFGTLTEGRKATGGQTLALERGGIRFGFLGYSYPQEDTLNVIAAQIADQREAGCDVVIVSLHWGRETHMDPKSGQPGYAARIIDLGADVVWGHHPHVLQPVQFYKGKPVLFSTGNFIFGTMSQVEPATGIFQLSYVKTARGARLATFQAVPCMSGRSPHYQPRILEEPNEMARVWEFLRSAKAYADYQNLPESFLTTGVVRFGEDGGMVE